MKEISEIKNTNDQNSNKMKITLVINQKEYFGQNYHWNKIVNKCKVGGEIKSVNKNFFSDFTHLSELHLSNGITEIEDFTFKDCISIKQISNSTSIKSIGNG